MDLDVVEGLEVLNYPLDKDALKTAVADGPLTQEFTRCVCWLTKEIKELYKLDEVVTEDESSFLFEISSFLKELGCEYVSLTEGNIQDRLKTRNSRLKLLDYLINETFGARIAFIKNQETKKTDDATELNPC